MLKLKAIINVDLPIKKDLINSGAFPLNVGALTIRSKDGKREYVIDSSHTNYISPKTKGGVLSFESQCDVDLEIFPLAKDNYNITEEDLHDCVGVFYCSDTDCEDGEDCFDYDKARAIAIITDIDTEKEYKIPITLEV